MQKKKHIIRLQEVWFRRSLINETRYISLMKLYSTKYTILSLLNLCIIPFVITYYIATRQGFLYISRNVNRLYVRFIWGQEFNRRIDYIEKILSEKKAVLDLGCGMASYSGYRFGIDINKKALLKSTSDFRPSIRGDCINIPLGKDSVDAVILVDLLHHVKDTEKTLKEIFRILKPGGEVFISEEVIEYGHAKRKLGVLWDGETYDVDFSKIASISRENGMRISKIDENSFLLKKI